MTCEDSDSVLFSAPEEVLPKVTATGIRLEVPRDGAKALRGCEDGQQ